MSTLLLVRHGQAHAFEADSDRLTERGAAQAKRAGEYFVESGVRFDVVRTGTLLRQRDTARIVGEAFRVAGVPFPDPVASPEWNEYPADAVLGVLLPELARVDAEFAGLVSEFQAGAARPDRNRYFQRMFEVLMDRWERGDVTAEGVETFDSFHRRVRSELGAILSAGGKGTVGVFTSGGPIGVCVQEVLEAPRRTALRLNFRVQNASITEMVFSGGRVSLDAFNAVGHLPRDERTFR